MNDLSPLLFLSDKFYLRSIVYHHYIYKISPTINGNITISQPCILDYKSLP